MIKSSVKNLNINEIEALSIEEAKTIALEKLNIKGFDIYLVDLEYFVTCISFKMITIFICKLI